MTESADPGCHAPLHPRAAEGLRLFNAGEFFESHEALEDAWREETGEVRNLYRGILQIAVTYLHVRRGNYDGAIKVHARSQKWLKDWPDMCRGISVGVLRNDALLVMAEVRRLGKEQIAQIDTALLKPIHWDENLVQQKRSYVCDRCGHEMREKNCNVTCPNCGNRFDCSDLNIYFD